MEILSEQERYENGCLGHDLELAIGALERVIESLPPAEALLDELVVEP